MASRIDGDQTLLDLYAQLEQELIRASRALGQYDNRDKSFWDAKLIIGHINDCFYQIEAGLRR